ncbi:hypothetical protein CU100_00945 [Phyllobacterium endophyticum]|uniref:Uncharacterized protein n=1 Tax=Phyllobacterium endophyticum TaxID=1149773 RepID=A0A2P7AYW2_9HYPH|nr:hypothetical protein CU100_00945 [Phyllobacterium endophyticum]
MVLRHCKVKRFGLRPKTQLCARKLRAKVENIAPKTPFFIRNASVLLRDRFYFVRGRRATDNFGIKSQEDRLHVFTRSLRGS